MLGESFYPCTPLLASRLDLSWVGYFAAAPIEPYMTAIWPECPRRHFVPNPLSYFPQMGQSTTSQFMVRPDPSTPHSPSDFYMCINTETHGIAAALKFLSVSYYFLDENRLELLF